MIKKFNELQEEQNQRRYALEDAISHDLFYDDDKTHETMMAFESYLKGLTYGSIREGLEEYIAVIDKARSAPHTGWCEPVNRLVALSIIKYSQDKAMEEFPILHEDVE